MLELTEHMLKNHVGTIVQISKYDYGYTHIEWQPEFLLVNIEMYNTASNHLTNVKHGGWIVHFLHAHIL